VDHHLTLSQTAQRRNVEDPATVAEFAAVVQNQDNLDALMLLTLADGLGTGGETWSDWKESLVWDLYNNASRYLSVGEAFHELRKSERAELKTEVRGKMAKDYAAEIEAHFESMPDSYFHGADAGDVAGHLRLFRRLFEGLAREGAEPTTPALRWTARPAQGHSEVWVCTWDRKELLARLAGSFAAAGLNILSADIFTRLDNLVLDIFRVCGPEHEPVTEEKTLLAVEKTMRKALSTDSFDFAPLLAKARSRLWATPSPEIDFPIRIAVLNDAHPVYTVVELQVPDRIALLYDILRAFATESVNILFSRIATENGAALDAFYVTGPDGRKIEAEPAVRRLQKALRSACEKKE
jgi:[protein-PII] uridylyltransferase